MSYLEFSLSNKRWLISFTCDIPLLVSCFRENSNGEMVILIILQHVT